mgnify:CR=1 FL=1
MQNSENIFRQEIRHYIKTYDYERISSNVSESIKNGGSACRKESYAVKTVMFASSDKKRSKVNMSDTKEYFSLKFYENNSCIKLIKNCIKGSYFKKISEIISIEQAKRILDCDIKWMYNTCSALLRELSVIMNTELLIPKNIIWFYRDAYEQKNKYRLTIDRDIKFADYTQSLLDKNPAQFDAEDNNTMLLKLKYPRIPPENILKLI